MSTKWTNTAVDGLIHAHEEVQSLHQIVYHHSVGRTRKKILCISDLHIPFHHIDLIKQIIRKHKNADILVINGDLLDHYSVSSFVKDKYVSLQSEYMLAIDFLKWVSKLFSEVYLVKGNHELRLNTWFNKRVNPDVGWLFSREILSRLAAGHIYDEVGNIIDTAGYDNVFYPGGEEAWWIKIGRAMFQTWGSWGQVLT